MLAAGAALAMLLAATGCGAFFQCEGKTSCGTSSGGGSTGTGDYVYVSYNINGNNYIGGYTVGSSTLTAITGSPFAVGYVPVGMAVSPNNEFLYVAALPGTSDSGVWMYTINSAGAVTGGTQEDSDLIGAMAVSPDGNFLFEIDSSTGTIITEYKLNTSTGAMSYVTTFSAPGTSLIGCALTNTSLLNGAPSSQNCSIAVAPTNDYVAVALNTVGTAIFPYTSSGGITSNNYVTILPPTTLSGDYSLAFDGTDHLYVASTFQLTPYNSLASPVAGTGYTAYESGATPRSVTLSTTYGYLFTANEGTSDIQEFTVSGGAVTALGTTPHVTGPASVSALGVERSGTYLLAAGYNSTNGLQMFTISSSGLTAVANQGTGSTTTVPVVMALTH
jgi:6-phosphogluconolactonase